MWRRELCNAPARMDSMTAIRSLTERGSVTYRSYHAWMINETEWTPAQRHFAEAIYSVVESRGDWPRFDYLEQQQYKRGYDARKTFSSFPVLGQAGLVGLPSYCEVRSPDHLGGLRAESRVALTVAGFWHLHQEDSPAATFLELLSVAGRRRLDAEFDPIDAITVQLTDGALSEEIAGLHTREARWLLGELVRTEPYAVTGLVLRSGPGPDGSWLADIESPAMRFAGGEVSLDEYVELINETFTETPTPQPRVLASPLALLTALNYLDVTWRLHCPRPLLFRSFSLESTARLAFDVADEDEFKVATSVLGDLLKNMHPHSGPGASGHPVSQLRAYLGTPTAALDQDNQAAAIDALDRLENVTRIRNGLLHSEAATEGLEAWHRLGLRYPPNDWPALWAQVRSIATEAVMELREVVEKLPPRGCTEPSHSPE